MEKIERKAFQVANFEPTNGFEIVFNKKFIEEVVKSNGDKLKEVVFRRPFAGIRVDAGKIQLTNENPIPVTRPEQRAMFDRGDIAILNREFRENHNIAPGMRVKMFLHFKGGKKR